MSTETHINALKAELDETIKVAHQAIDEVAQKLEVYLQRYRNENPETATMPVPAVSNK